jgi:hypothetical protein
MLMAGCAESRGIRVEREQGKRSWKKQFH